MNHATNMVRRRIFPVTSGFSLQKQLYKRWQAQVVQTSSTKGLPVAHHFSHKEDHRFHLPHSMVRIHPLHPWLSGTRTWRSWLKSSKRCGDLTSSPPRAGSPFRQPGCSLWESTMVKPRSRASAWSASMWPMAIPRPGGGIRSLVFSKGMSASHEVWSGMACGIARNHHKSGKKRFGHVLIQIVRDEARDIWQSQLEVC